ncbi:GntR family transcriptional regulator [Bradyrhizobium sp. Cp5.3]|uniref:GntR family transcriptional regulator n=1 Tax=Bradyrhizobium sp. Cp5.3 TaxID=443598 RepID=UPI0004893EA4|nr:FCD domain-containing protein [Bradyrhizobium sp. Cp5.3]
MRSPATTPDNAQTLNASVLAQMRADILGCRLAPSERLRVESLRERYGMGTSPIREALMRLEAEGLVDLEQNKGFRVSDVSLENLRDVMNTRIEIESVALRWSLERGGLDWEANLLSSFHRLSRQTKINPSRPDAISDAWWKEHADFHSALVSGCGSPTLLSIRSRLFEQAERYVVLSILSKGPMRDDVDEHKQLMRAAVDRDVERAIELNRMHISRTLQKVAASLVDGKKAASARRPEKRSLK